MSSVTLLSSLWGVDLILLVYHINTRSDWSLHVFGNPSELLWNVNINCFTRVLSHVSFQFPFLRGNLEWEWPNTGRRENRLDDKVL